MLTLLFNQKQSQVHELPEVTTGEPSDIASTSFTANGELVDSGGIGVYERGFCYVEGDYLPTIENSVVSEYASNVETLWENKFDRLIGLGIQIEESSQSIVEISPAGQLHVSSTGTSSSNFIIFDANASLVLTPHFPIAFEIRIKFDQLATMTYDFNTLEGSIGFVFQAYFYDYDGGVDLMIAFGSNGIFSVDSNTYEQTRIGTVIPKCNENADWQTWRFLCNRNSSEMFSSDDGINFTSQGTFYPHYSEEEFGIMIDVGWVVVDSTEIHFDNVKFGNYSGNLIPIEEGEYSLPITGISPYIHYSVRSYAINAVGVGYGDVVGYEYNVPEMLTNDPTDVGFDSLTANGEIVSNHEIDISERGFCYVEGEGTPTIEDNIVNELWVDVTNTNEFGELPCDSLDEFEIIIPEVEPPPASIEISPAGQLHVSTIGMGLEAGDVTLASVVEIPTSTPLPIMVEMKIKFDQLALMTADPITQEGTYGFAFIIAVYNNDPSGRLAYILMGSNGVFAYVYDPIYESFSVEQIGTVIPKCNENADWQTWRFVFYEDNTIEVLSSDDGINFTSQGFCDSISGGGGSEDESDVIMQLYMFDSSEIHLDYLRVGGYERIITPLPKGEYSLPITGISSDKNYRLCSYAVNEAGVGYGNIIDLNNAPPPPPDPSAIIRDMVLITPRVRYLFPIRIREVLCTPIYRQGEEAGMLTFDPKQSYEEYYVVFNFSRVITPLTTIEDTIVSVTDESGTDVTSTLIDNSKTSVTGSKVYVWVRGGSEQTYKITCRIVMDNDEKFEQDAELEVTEI